MALFAEDITKQAEDMSNKKTVSCKGEIWERLRGTSVINNSKCTHLESEISLTITISDYTARNTETG
jgi:hypothetical protein